MERRVNTPEGRAVKRVTLDGEDVTNRCFACDAEAGTVDLYVCREGTRTFKFDPATRMVAVERRTGRVEAFDRDGNKLA